MVKVNNRNIRKTCEICWKLTCVFIINFEHISQISLFVLLTSSMCLFAGNWLNGNLIMLKKAVPLLPSCVSNAKRKSRVATGRKLNAHKSSERLMYVHVTSCVYGVVMVDLTTISLCPFGFSFMFLFSNTYLTLDLRRHFKMLLYLLPSLTCKFLWEARIHMYSTE